MASVSAQDNNNVNTNKIDSMNTTIDPRNGYCSKRKTYYSLRPTVPLPPPTTPLSAAEYALSLLPSTIPTNPFLISSSTGHRLSYPSFLRHVHSLSLSLSTHFSLSPNDAAFILLPPSFHVPIVYFSLLYLGVVISPANPLSSESEIAYQVGLSKPVIAFATSQTVKKIPTLPLGTILVDSPEFDSLLNNSNSDKDDGGIIPYFNNAPGKKNRVNQTDTAAILYSSGTTGRVKGVLLTHRNIIALLAGISHLKKLMLDSDEPVIDPVLLFPLPMFHVFGFFMVIRAIAVGETLVLLEKFDFEKMLMAVEKYRCSFMPVSPPLVVAFAKSDLTNKYDLSSLRVLGCGGAPLGKEVAERFKQKFPNVEITQGYGMTETMGGGTRTINPEESMNYGSIGRLSENFEAKIVDPATGEALPPGQRGELWLRGPTVMKGYVGDDKATAEALDSDGWLRTGDLCYFDFEGFLYIVDRLKELIKYKAYQVPPAELEHLLQSNPEIADAAVIPYPDEEAGQIPMAYIVRKPGSSITESQVMEFVANQVAPYKKIRRVAFINSIPKSPAGKILRRELVNHATSVGRAKL